MSDKPILLIYKLLIVMFVVIEYVFIGVLIIIKQLIE